MFPWLFSAVGSIVLFYGAKNYVQAHDSVKWPTVQGTVERSTIESDRGNHGKVYSPHVVYVYSVNGSTFRGDRVSGGDYGSSSSSHAEKVIDQYPVGAVVEVHYLPGNPEVCLLEPGVTFTVCIYPIFGAMFLAAGVCLFLFLPKNFSQRVKETIERDIELDERIERSNRNM